MNRGTSTTTRPRKRDPDQTHSQAEFVTLLDPVLSRAYAAARYMTGNAADADDLVQEAALLAWKGFHSFQPGTNFRAWFLKILTNAFYNRHRRRRREGDAVSLDDAPDLYLYEKTAEAGLHTNERDPARAFLSRLDTQQVQEAIQALPDEYRAAAALYFVEDLSYQEIADALECPVGTVRSRLHRGRKMLQVSLWRLAQQHGIAPPDEAARTASEPQGGGSDR